MMQRGLHDWQSPMHRACWNTSLGISKDVGDVSESRYCLLAGNRKASKEDEKQWRGHPGDEFLQLPSPLWFGLMASFKSIPRM